MAKIATRRTAILGLVSWAVPLAAPFLFFDRMGQLTVSQPLFKPHFPRPGVARASRG